ncbi:MAG: CotH kinase family protein [Anaerolineae bacterium]|jgi:spore coat protein CotH|nr:CotH kinase family protein [Anaerolineae bacterium]
MLKKVLSILMLLSILLLSACSPSIANAEQTISLEEGTSAEVLTGPDADATEPEQERQTEATTSDRPADWSEEAHGKDAEPNYAVVFPQDQVNQITITIEPEDWEVMQANMVELYGEAGAGENQLNFAGQDGEPPMGEPPQPGEELPQNPQENFRPGENNERPRPGENNGQNLQQPGELRPGVDNGIRDGKMVSENPTWVEATIEFNGLTWTNVGVRYKGNSSLMHSWKTGTLKLPFKLDFDEFEDEYPEIDDQRFYGFKQLSLANGFSDASFLRDAITADILADAGLPAAETAFYEVFLDYGEGPVSLGLYTMIEVIDDTAVERYFGSDDGNIYEGEGSAASFAANTYDQIEESFQKENNEDSDWSDIEAFFDVLHSDLRSTDPAVWRAEMESVFNVDAFLEWLAISAVIQHWDGYGAISHNYYLYHNPETDQLTWISWDHNQAMQQEMGGINRPNDRSVTLDKAEIDESWPLIRFLLDDPVYSAAYLAYLQETIEGPFNADAMADKYQAMADLIEPYAIADVGEDAFEAAVQQLIQHAYQRAEAVEAFLATNRQ